ncbi:hypothetical protein A2U01_0063227, partial [Trifolium medium]|nr:hypothetical protein [Trifolium medium]
VVICQSTATIPPPVTGKLPEPSWFARTSVPPSATTDNLHATTTHIII